MLRRQFVAGVVASVSLLSASPSNALTSGQLARKSLLKISNTTDGTETVIGIDDLRNMPTSKLTTTTPWTDGAIEFEGVYFRDIVTRFGSGAKVGRATAFNDYQIDFELSEIMAKDGFLAFSQDGKPMSRRDKGPFWVVFPWTERPELDTRSVHGLSIWQLVDLSFN